MVSDEHMVHSPQPCRVEGGYQHELKKSYAPGGGQGTSAFLIDCKNKRRDKILC